MKTCWVLFRSIIEAYKSGKTCREQFIFEYGYAQKIFNTAAGAAAARGKRGEECPA